MAGDVRVVPRGADVLLRPVDPSFDQAVETMAQTFTGGFAVSEAAPASFDALCAALDAGRPLDVWSGASTHTIYGRPQVNHAFRAWHDWCHWRGRHPFTLVGEAAVVDMQMAQLQARYGDGPEVQRWRALLLAEVLGQAMFHEVQGKFPDNQRRFVNALVALLSEEQAAVPGGVVPQHRR